MNNTATKKQWLFALLSAVLIIAIVAGAIITRPTPAEIEIPSEVAMEIAPENQSTDEALDPFEPILRETLEQIEKQEEVDKTILAELNSGEYSFKDPLVIVDPYDQSPLTALAVFTSEEPLNISIHIEGKTELADVDYTFEGYNTEHLIPVYGLYADTNNNVLLTAKTANGLAKQVELVVQTDPLPSELAKNIILTDVVETESYQPGFNFNPAPKNAFDANGDYRWFLIGNYLGSTNYNNNDRIVCAIGADVEGDVLFTLRNQLGRIRRALYAPYGVHHDIDFVGKTAMLVTGSHGETIEDFMYEIDVETGEIVNTLDLKQVLQRTRILESTNYNTGDWLHQNTIVYDNGSVIISGRHQSAVARLSWPEGKLEWILSDHRGWNPMFNKYLLEPIGDNFEWQYTQHAPEILPDYDNNPNTIDILLFDNGAGRFLVDKELQRAIANKEVVEPELYSRMVHYRINEKEKTVEQIWQFGKELGETYFATYCGNARLLKNGNRFGTFNRPTFERGQGINSNLIEVNESGNIIWEAYATSSDNEGWFGTYRMERLPMYTDAANSLGIGEPAKNLIPVEVLEKYGYK